MLTAEVVDDFRALLPVGTKDIVVGLVGGLLTGATEARPVPLVQLAVEVLWHADALDAGSRDELVTVLHERQPAGAILDRPRLLTRVLTAATGPPAGWESLVEELRDRGARLVDAAMVADVEPQAVALHAVLRRWTGSEGDRRARLTAAAGSLVPVLMTAARLRGDAAAVRRLLEEIEPGVLDTRAAAALVRESALGTVGIGGMGTIRPPRDDAERTAFVRRVAPVRSLLEQALDADPEDLWSRLLLGLLLHCEGSVDAADHLDAVTARLAAHGLVPELAADLRFHAGLARLRRLEGAGEADGDGG